MHKANRRVRLHHLLIFHNQVQVDRFRKHRVLRPKGNNRACHINFGCLWRKVPPLPWMV